MFYLVCYDISDDDRLRRVAKTMLGYGERVQKSVFECELDEEPYRRMLADVQRVMDAGKDSLRCYRLCNRCKDEREAYGIARVSELPDVYIV